MLEHLELIAIIPVQPRYGAKPHEAIGIFENTIYPVVGKAIQDIEMRKLVYIFLRIQTLMYSKKQKDGYNNPEAHSL